MYEQAFAPPDDGWAQIVIFGQGPDDYIQIADSILVAAYIFSGAGNDNIKGGGGNGILIGGYGADRLVGTRDDGILIAGYTAYDNNDDALCAIMKEWTSGGTYSYSHRFVLLTAGVVAQDVLYSDRMSVCVPFLAEAWTWHPAKRSAAIFLLP